MTTPPQAKRPQRWNYYCDWLYTHVVITHPPSGAKRRRAVQERRRAVGITECCVSISNKAVN